MIYNLFTSTGIDLLLKAASSRRIRVLMYHGVIDDNQDYDCWWLMKQSVFSAQMAFVKKNFEVVTLDEACKWIQTGQQAPEYLAVLTFDDGYLNFKTHALPILKELDVPATLYVPTGLIADGTQIWADRLYDTFMNYDSNSLDLSELALGFWNTSSREKKAKAAKIIINRLKHRTKEERTRLIDTILLRLDIPLNRNNSPFKLLSIEDVKSLSMDPLVTLGSHTVTHDILTSLPPEEVLQEISVSKEQLEAWTGLPVRHFSYPAGFFNIDISRIVQECGYISAVLDGHFDRDFQDIFQIPRIGIGAFDDTSLFRCKVNGLIAYKEWIKHKIFRYHI